MKNIAIMQPTYLPWIGYFAMIDRVDEFVFLDSVQFEHRSWQQRNQIKSANGALWLSIPVQIKGNRDAAIKDMQIQEPENTIKKHWSSITQNYSKAPYYKKYAPDLATIMQEAARKGIGALNSEIIIWFCNKIGIETPILYASRTNASGKKAELLANICIERGADHYLSAPGSREYIEESSDFSDKGIDVSYHKYDHPVYKQLYPPFLPYMSILDLLMNCGTESLAILRSGIKT